MSALRLRRHFVAAMVKHLPPSAAQLRLLDLDGESGALLAEARPDLVLLRKDHCQPNAVDAITAYNLPLTSALLSEALRLLRPGGRLILVQSQGDVGWQHGEYLRENGFVRILVEPAVDGLGLLLRGEKPHTTADTVARIQQVAGADADSLDLASFRGRYLHLLIQQRPNKPVWKLAANEPIRWRAAAIDAQPQPILLAFSSLPEAVAFLQPAVLDGLIRDINKVGKFSRATAQSQAWQLRLNPTLESLRGESLAYIKVDPASAEAPDE